MLLSLLLGCVPTLTSDGAEPVSLEACVGDGNTWPMGEAVWTPPSTETGFSEGEVPPPFCLPDQLAEQVALWQFNGLWVLLDLSTMWCVGCQDLAGDAQALVDETPGLVYLTVLRQDMGTDPPDTEELLSWQTYWGLAQPIVSDAEGWSDPVTGGRAWPAVLLLDPDLRVVARVPETMEWASAARAVVAEHVE